MSDEQKTNEEFISTFYSNIPLSKKATCRGTVTVEFDIAHIILTNNNSANFLYQRYIKSYVAVFKGAKETAYLKGNQQWKNLKAAGDNENIEKEIHRLTLEQKLKQPKTLFTVWGRQSTTNTNPIHNSKSIMYSVVTGTDTTTKTDNTNTSSASDSSLSKKLSNRTTHPDAVAAYNLAVYDQIGQPSIEDRGQKSLLGPLFYRYFLEVIIEIASRGAAADPCRSSDLISPCMTLDELIERLKERDFVLSCSATYLRSGKHDSSTAETNHHNFSLLFDSKEFEPVMKINGQCKPIVIICVDGGPDENPRYAKTLVGGVNLFKKYQLDCLFVVSNCPGRSAFNMVERRMAPLSNQLAGECLVEVWNELTIDYYSVACRYIEPVDKKDSSSLLNPNTLDVNWLQIHVRQSQYLLQIIKSAAMKRHKRLHSSKYLKQQKAIIVKKEKQVQVIDGDDSESGEESEDDNILQNKTNIIPGTPLIENIFDFLAKTKVIPYDRFIQVTRVVVDDPSSHVARQALNMKSLHLTKYVLKILPGERSKTVKTLWNKHDINKKNGKNHVGLKKLQAKHLRSKLTDFDRF
ncbi:unnamed protein product [Rotaria sordida]|uniref:Large ribosomal subunit protein eL14 domain-containing protein n=2 Tax=Rotaria sordida TaxID=392033 RepID=A0A819D3Q5_9BILA|nr:unnamed protein product [Rotaria sordida]CAF3828958.1 unnamed protein product [Rotaria sordida]